MSSEEREVLEEKLKYFKDSTVPTFMTIGIQRELPEKLIPWLLSLPFSISLRNEFDMDSFLILDIEAEETEAGTLFGIKLTQEEPEKTLIFRIELNCKPWSGRVYIIETWNGEKVSKTLDDHYITILLPSEY